MLNIYYDPTYDDTNLGWKVSDTENDGKVVARFTTHKAAIDYCTFIGVDYKVLVEECYEDDDKWMEFRLIPGTSDDE